MISRRKRMLLWSSVGGRLTFVHVLFLDTNLCENLVAGRAVVPSFFRGIGLCLWSLTPRKKRLRHCAACLKVFAYVRVKGEQVYESKHHPGTWTKPGGMRATCLVERDQGFGYGKHRPCPVDEQASKAAGFRALPLLWYSSLHDFNSLRVAPG